MKDKRLWIRVALIVGFMIVFGTIFNIVQNNDSENMDIDYDRFNKYYGWFISKDQTQQDFAYTHFLTNKEKSSRFLMEKLANEKGNHEKKNILGLLGYLDCVKCVEDILPYLQDPDRGVRVFAINAIGLLKYEHLSSLVVKIIDGNENAGFKIIAIMALGDGGGKDDIAFLEGIKSKSEFKNSDYSKKIINESIEKIRSRHKAL